MKFGVFERGAEVNALILNGEAIAVGDLLESGADGYLREVDADASAGDISVGSVIAQALEACDMSGSSGVDPSPRCKVLIL